MKVTKVLLNIMSVVGFIYGALYCFSLVFIPVGVYCFIAARRFSYKAEHLFDDYAVTNKTIKRFTIFVCIACFPFGLLAIIPCYKLLTNNIEIKGFNYTDTRDISPENEVKIETIVEEKPESSKEEVKETSQEETEEEKLEKFEKLKNFNKKGIITDDELEMARKQLFGDKE
ncbi:MAG: hypothetical protein J6J33_04845 [Clostridia bacterium]|nr:hypothetical protein [Clostridia bacterium]